MGLNSFRLPKSIITIFLLLYTQSLKASEEFKEESKTPEQVAAGISNLHRTGIPPTVCNSETTKPCKSTEDEKKPGSDADSTSDRPEFSLPDFSQTKALDSSNEKFSQNIYDKIKDRDRTKIEVVPFELKGRKLSEGPNIFKPRQETSTVVKVIGPNGYDGPKAQDFVDRLDIVTKSAIFDVFIKLRRSNPKKMWEVIKTLKEKRREVKELLLKRNEGLAEEVRSLYELSKNFHAMTKNNKQEKKLFETTEKEISTNSKKILEKIEKAKAQIKHFIEVAAEEINSALYPSHKSSGVDKHHKKGADIPSYTVDDIKTAEKNLLHFLGRKNIAHLYTVGDSKKPQEQHTFMSTHRSYYQKAPMPTSGKRDVIGLGNALVTSVQSIDKDGKVKTEFSGYRHTSYTPIQIFAPGRVWNSGNERQVAKIKRRSFGMKNKLEQIQKIVEDYYSETGKCPTTIPLATQMLVTPFNTMTFFKQYESEILQLKESYLLTSMFHNRKLDIELRGGRVCKGVIPQSTMMNTKSNVSNGYKRIGLKLGTHSNQEIVNSRGYYEFNQYFRNYLIENFPAELADTDDRHLLERYRNESRLDLKKIEIKFNEAVIDEKDKNGKKTGNKIDLRQALKQIYDTIHEKQTESLSPGDVLTHKELKSLDELYKEAWNLEVKINEIFSSVNKESPSAELIESLESKLIAKMDSALSNKSFGSETIEAFDRYRDILRIYRDNKKLYLKTNVFSPNDGDDLKNQLQFQSNYLYGFYRMGFNVEFFCKSGEDRTGRIDNGIQEKIVFKKRYGHLPSYDNEEDSRRLYEISTRVFHGSSSRDTNGMNNPGARALQIDDEDDSSRVNYGVSIAKIENMMAKLAKQVYGDGGGED